MSEVSISAIAEINPASRVPAGLQKNDLVSFIPMGDVSEAGQWSPRQTRPLSSLVSGFTAFTEGDVLVAKITPCMENGKGAHAVGLVNGVGFGSTEFHVLRAKQGVSPRFVFQLTKWKKFRQEAESAMVGSAGQKRVQRSFFDSFSLTGFNEGDQLGIAKVLDTLDTAIHETEALIAKLKAVKQGLLHDLLTRGIDANGELRPPQSEAPHLYKSSLLGWIPTDWETPCFSDLQFQPLLGVGVRGASEDAANYGLLKMGNLRENNEIDLRSVELVAASRVPHADKLLLSDGDLLFNTRNTPELVGKTCSWRNVEGEHVFDNNILRARIPSHIGSGHFFAHYLGSEVGRRRVRRLATGTTSVAAIYWKDLKDLRVPAPSAQEQNAIHRIIDEHDKSRAFTERNMSALHEAKLGLMDNLLTGRVRVTPLLDAATA